MLFSITQNPITTEDLKQTLKVEYSGGYVSFEGWVRNHHNGRDVKKLIYSAYEPMAIKIGTQIVEKALSIFDINNACCIHRIGDLMIGDIAVWVGVSAGHRGAAFEACKYIIDTIKLDVPIWKHEYYLDGTDTWTLNHQCN